MLEYSPKCASDETASAHFEQPMMTELSLSFVNTFPGANESICSIKLYLPWKNCLMTFGNTGMLKYTKG